MEVLSQVAFNGVDVQLVAEESKEFANNGLFGFAKPWTEIDENVLILIGCGQFLFYDFEESGFACAISLVDIDDQRAIGTLLLLGSKSREDFGDEKTGRCGATI